MPSCLRRIGATSGSHTTACELLNLLWPLACSLSRTKSSIRRRQTRCVLTASCPSNVGPQGHAMSHTACCLLSASPAPRTRYI